MFKKIKKFILWLFLGSAVLAGGYSALPDTVPDIAKEKMLIAYDNAPIIKAKYKMQNASFIMEAVDENAMQTEIGDKTKDKFMPEMTLRKWDDEVNFKIKYKHNEKEKDLKFELDGEKIKLKGKKIETHFYEMDNENYEFEIILLEKPITNIVSFDIEIKGLNFYYQPELTQKEKDDGAFRPENIVGSYAVYHSTKQGDYTKLGKKNYKAGKAFHIYRPLIIDSASTTAYGILNINTETGKLTVEMPPDFYNNAVYPVKHAAGLTFGCDPSSPPLTATLIQSNRFYSYMSYSVAGGTAESISAYVKDSSDDFKGVLVKNSDKTIVTNGVGNSVAAGADYAWTTSSFGTSPVIDIGNYQIGIVGNATFWYIMRDSVNNAGWYDSSNSYTSPTNPTDGSIVNDKYGIYCTYTAGEEEPPAVKKRRVIRIQ